MRTTVVISAKLRDEYAELIKNGKKHYEIRTESFQNAQAIRFVSSRDGAELGIYRIKASYPADRVDDRRLIKMSGISVNEFYQLFPPINEGGPRKLWVAKLGEPITIEQIIRGTESRGE